MPDEEFVRIKNVGIILRWFPPQISKFRRDTEDDKVDRHLKRAKNILEKIVSRIETELDTTISRYEANKAIKELQKHYPKLKVVKGGFESDLYEDRREKLRKFWLQLRDIRERIKSVIEKTRIDEAMNKAIDELINAEQRINQLSKKYKRVGI